MRFACLCLAAGALFGSTALAAAQTPAATPSLTATPPSTTAGTQPQGTPSQGAPSRAGGASEPDVATLLFSRPQWTKAPAGAVLSYTYARKTTDPTFGRSFDDHIAITLSPGRDAYGRVVDVNMFSGPNKKPTGQFNSNQNPVLLLVLEENVQELAQIFGTNPRYLKNRIREAWRDHPTITPAQIDVDGKTVPGTRITVQPFADNAEASKMKGLDSMVYTVDIADSVPGNIANIDVHAPATGAPKFSETLHFSSMKAP